MKIYSNCDINLICSTDGKKVFLRPKILRMIASVLQLLMSDTNVSVHVFLTF